MSKMNDLHNMLRRPLGPSTHGQTFIEVRCYCDFEGHGRASETWEEHWSLRLPTVKGHWKANDGWRPTKPVGGVERGMYFHGRTYESVVNDAIEFLRWYKEGK